MSDGEKRISPEDDRINPLLGKAHESSVEIAFAASVCDLNLLRESASCCLLVSDLSYEAEFNRVVARCEHDRNRHSHRLGSDHDSIVAGDEHCDWATDKVGY